MGGLADLFGLVPLDAGHVEYIATWMPKPPGIGPMPTDDSMRVWAGSVIFCLPAATFIAPMKRAT